MHIDQRIQKVIDEVDELRETRNDAWQVPRVEGQMLFQIALAAGARKIVELGTSYGFSGLFWAAAARLTGGVLHTIDIDPAKYNASKENFRRAGLENVVVSHLGDALQVVRTIPGPIDIAFLDATNKEASRQYFELLWPHIRAGGSVLTDNVDTHRQELTPYVKYLRSRPDAASSEIPIGNGLEWTVKIG